MEVNKIYCGDNLEVTKSLPDRSVHLIVTSPSYYGLRDYGTAAWIGGDPDCDHRYFKGGHMENSPKQVTSAGTQTYIDKSACQRCGAKRIDQQIGMESTAQEYIERLVVLFCECRRVLRDDGVFFLNLGDSYASAWSADRRSIMGQGSRDNRIDRVSGTGFKEKDLMMMPARVAMALQEDGWYLRSVAPWIKANVMPESVVDRPTTSHEYVFQFSKSPRYYFDADAIRVAPKPSTQERIKYGWNGKSVIDEDGKERRAQPDVTDEMGSRWSTPGGRNRRSGDTFMEMLEAQIDDHKTGVLLDEDCILAFMLNQEPNSLAHFATWPPRLVKPMILAGSPETCCNLCGAPYTRQTVHEPMEIKRSASGAQMGEQGRTQSSGTMVKPASSTTLGFAPSCKCNATPARGVVYDPFMGSGTSALVARALGRDYIGAELNPDYVAMAEHRLRLPFEMPKAKSADVSYDDLPLFAGSDGAQ